jgi:hypothetical protein
MRIVPQRAEHAVNARQWHRSDLQMEVRAVAVDERAQCMIDVEHLWIAHRPPSGIP